MQGMVDWDDATRPLAGHDVPVAGRQKQTREAWGWAAGLGGRNAGAPGVQAECPAGGFDRGFADFRQCVNSGDFRGGG
ncbi:MAG: hypothetical protein RLZZ458_3783 [Planctomycetota bacterium]